MKTIEFLRYASLTQLLILAGDNTSVEEVKTMICDGEVTGGLLHAARQIRAWSQESPKTRLGRLIMSRMLPKRNRVHYHHGQSGRYV